MALGDMAQVGVAAASHPTGSGRCLEAAEQALQGGAPACLLLTLTPSPPCLGSGNSDAIPDLWAPPEDRSCSCSLTLPLPSPPGPLGSPEDDHTMSICCTQGRSLNDV